MKDKVAMTSRRFFKVMIPGFHQKLKLPPAFCKKLKEEEGLGLGGSQEGGAVFITSRKGIWKMEMCRNDDDGQICFKEGWPQFVHHHALTIGDFLVFELIQHTTAATAAGDDLHFNALIFDRSACEKELFLVDQSSKKLKQDAKTHLGKRGDRPGMMKRELPKSHFILTMKPYHAHRRSMVNIPAEFGRSMKLNDKSSVTLRDPRGRAWTLELSVKKCGQFRIRFCSGWHGFYASNHLKEGDVCRFDLINPHHHQSLAPSTTTTSVLMDVQIFPAPA